LTDFILTDFILTDFILTDFILTGFLPIDYNPANVLFLMRTWGVQLRYINDILKIKIY